VSMLFGAVGSRGRVRPSIGPQTRTMGREPVALGIGRSVASMLNTGLVTCPWRGSTLTGNHGTAAARHRVAAELHSALHWPFQESASTRPVGRVCPPQRPGTNAAVPMNRWVQAGHGRAWARPSAETNSARRATRRLPLSRRARPLQMDALTPPNSVTAARAPVRWYACFAE
jgi:hypothetical protein